MVKDTLSSRFRFPELDAKILTKADANLSAMRFFIMQTVNVTALLFNFNF